MPAQVLTPTGCGEGHACLRRPPGAVRRRRRADACFTPIWPIDLVSGRHRRQGRSVHPTHRSSVAAQTGAAQ